MMLFSRTDPSKAQETKDALCISTWKSSLKGYGSTTCSKELCDYMDERMPGWRVDHHSGKPSSNNDRKRKILLIDGNASDSDSEKKKKKSDLMMHEAKEIVARFEANGKRYPTLKQECRKDPSRVQEYSDAKRLHVWKCHHISDSQAATVFELLDKRMPQWRNTTLPKKTMTSPISKAREIFRRCQIRGGSLPRLIPTCDQTTSSTVLEHRDAMQLRAWKKSYDVSPESFCPRLKEYITSKLKLWQRNEAKDCFSVISKSWSHERTRNGMIGKGSVGCGAETDDELLSSDPEPNNRIVSLSPMMMQYSDTANGVPRPLSHGNIDAVHALLNLRNSPTRFKFVSGEKSVSDFSPKKMHLQNPFYYQPHPCPNFLFVPVNGRSTYGNGKKFKQTLQH